MYNRYIPDGTTYSRIPEEDAPPHRPSSAQRQASNSRPRRPSPKEGGTLDSALSWLSGLLKSIHLEEIDTGDILLILILLFLFLESDDNLELVITLGLLLVFGLFGREEPKQNEKSAEMEPQTDPSPTE